MKFSDDMRYPHPVLTPDSGDYPDGTFDVWFEVREILETGRVSLEYRIELAGPDIQELIESGRATAGVFVRCGDTYYSALKKLDWPSGTLEFPPGRLLNRVTVRPLIWLENPLPSWHPGGVSPEFDLPLALGRGDVLAMAYEVVLSIGQAKLAPMESIFSIQRSSEVDEGRLEVDLNAEKITIKAGEQTFQLLTQIRFRADGRAAALAAVYLPAVMDTLDQLRGEAGAFEGRRWFAPFTSKCDALGVNLENPDLFEDAQKLLRHPIRGLEFLVES